MQETHPLECMGVLQWAKAPALGARDASLGLMAPPQALKGLAVAAAFILVWRSGIAARLACLPLIATQIAWGGDAYFYPTHAVIHQSPIKAVTDLMSAYFRKDARPLLPFGGWFDAGTSPSADGMLMASRTT
jgi:hypothetical protein